MQVMTKHIFWPTIDCSSLYATTVTRGQDAVLRSIGGRSHFRSCDKDGSHTIRSAMAKTPWYMQTPWLYLQGYCRLKFYMVGLANFVYFFCEKYWKIFYNLFAPRKGRRLRGITSFASNGGTRMLTISCICTLAPSPP